MPSHDVFLSSSPRARRQALNIDASSSPGLPSVQTILSQNPQRPPLRKPPFPKNATSITSTSACRPWRSLQAEESNEKAIEDIDTSFSVIEVSPDSLQAAGKVRRRKKTGPIRPQTPSEQTTSGDLQADAQPWKKYKSPKRSPEETSAIDSKPSAEARLCPERTSGADKGDCSRYFIKPGEPQKKKETKAAKRVTDEPLNLEAAMERRTEWTPPTQRVRIILDSDDTLDVNATRSSQLHDGQVGSFENVVASYRCEETMQIQAGSVPADDGGGNLQNRRLMEFVPTNAGTASEASKRQKAPRKKTRTLTDIATRAYRPATQPDIVADENRASTTAASDETGKGKTKPRKRPSRAAKKKEAPPKPILLSPEAALRQVAHQDFMFGTSSQLAHEKSPSQRPHNTVMKDLCPIDMVDLRTPINSDAIEPADQRQTLWDAGARDEDGDLFDVEVGLLADGPPELAEAATEADPFGYVPAAVSLPSRAGSDEARDDDDSLVSLPDMVAARSGKPLTMAGDDSVLSGGERVATLPGKKPAAKRQRTVTTTEGDKNEKHTAVAPGGQVEARYELYTDGQLAKQVAQYGFKPIKKREAMIALLNRCRPGVGATFAGPPGSRSASTSTVEKKKKKMMKPGASRSKAVGMSEEEEEEEADDDDKEAQIPTKGNRRRGRSKSGNASDEVQENQGVTMPTKKKKSQGRSGAAVCISDDEARKPTQDRKRRRSPSTAKIASDEELDWFLKPKRPRSRSKAGSDSDKGSRKAAVDSKTTQEKRRRRSPSIAEIASDEELEWFLMPKRHRSRSKSASDSDSKKRGRSRSRTKGAGDEPPPSGQRSKSPRRRKTSSRSRRGKKKSYRREIADSQSDSADDSAGSSSSSSRFGLAADETMTMSSSLSPTEQQKELFAHISKAVTTASRTTKTKQPSWHDKILLYDPIVLEDLTAWLNSGQLTRVGCDEEASAVEVKAWSRQMASSRHMMKRLLTTTTTTTTPAEARASASVMVLSPRNEVLMVRRAPTSTSFASAHVFPGGQLDEFHDGTIPGPNAPDRHRDGPAYRLAAVRECFEETGVLLAVGGGAESFRLSSPERDEARRSLHAGEVRFGTWLKKIGAVADTDGLIPMTRWITPATMARRFTTQMYIYPMSKESALPKPTTDGEKGENTTADFWPIKVLLDAVARGTITVFPPQYYLLHRLARRKSLLLPAAAVAASSEEDYDDDKVICPRPLKVLADRRVVLALDEPGPELEGSDRKGDAENVLLVEFAAGGPSMLEVRCRRDVMALL